MAILELVNCNLYESCNFDPEEGPIAFKKPSDLSAVKGHYFKDDKSFLAIYATADGPMIYCDGKTFPLKKTLHIKLGRDGDERRFVIMEYGVYITYQTPYDWFFQWDNWSDEKDVDLLYRIAVSYQDDAFYEWYTAK